MGELKIGSREIGVQRGLKRAIVNLFFPKTCRALQAAQAIQRLKAFTAADNDPLVAKLPWHNIEFILDLHLIEKKPTFNEAVKVMANFLPKNDIGLSLALAAGAHIFMGIFDVIPEEKVMYGRSDFSQFAGAVNNVFQRREKDSEVGRWYQPELHSYIQVFLGIRKNIIQRTDLCFRYEAIKHDPLWNYDFVVFKKSKKVDISPRVIVNL